MKTKIVQATHFIVYLSLTPSNFRPWITHKSQVNEYRSSGNSKVFLLFAQQFFSGRCTKMTSISFKPNTFTNENWLFSFAYTHRLHPVNLHVVLFIHDDVSVRWERGRERTFGAQLRLWSHHRTFRIMASNREISICNFQLKSIEKKCLVALFSSGQTPLTLIFL